MMYGVRVMLGCHWHLFHFVLFLSYVRWSFPTYALDLFLSFDITSSCMYDLFLSFCVHPSYVFGLFPYLHLVFSFCSSPYCSVDFPSSLFISSWIFSLLSLHLSMNTSLVISSSFHGYFPPLAGYPSYI
jgi:hypothetical protein